jgi:hypothetical protein
VLYESRDVLTAPLTLLFKESIQQGLVPDEWRHSIVSVLHEKGKKDNVENYRPISLNVFVVKLWSL